MKYQVIPTEFRLQMQRTLSLILIYLFAIHPVSVFAQERDPNRRLQEIFDDIRQETERYSKTHPLELVMTPAVGQAETQTSQENHADRVRAKAFATSIGTEVNITLHDGEIVRGELVEVDESHFNLRIPDADDRRFHLKDFGFDEVRTYLAGMDLREIPLGKTVELRLVEGDKARGRRNAVSDVGVTVNDRQITFDEIVSAKTVMRNRTKAIIILAIALPVAALFITAALGGISR